MRLSCKTELDLHAKTKANRGSLQGCSKKKENKALSPKLCLIMNYIEKIAELCPHTVLMHSQKSNPGETTYWAPTLCNFPHTFLLWQPFLALSLCAHNKSVRPPPSATHGFDDTKATAATFEKDRQSKAQLSSSRPNLIL